MKNLSIKQSKVLQNSKIDLPSSKSESNRALIIQALAKYQSNTKIDLKNISTARDTQTMLRLLESQDNILDVLDAGTTMRFLTAYLTITNQEKTLTGTVRMQERPIKILVEALQSLGFQIDYLKNEGFPPIQIKKVDFKNIQKSKLSIPANISSQYISALLMIAPLLPNGLVLELEGKISSRPYIQMTLDLIEKFAVNYTWNNNLISISKQNYKTQTYQIESDWSGASYWLSLVALSENLKLELIGLRENSLQGDKAIIDLMQNFGVKSIFTKEGLEIEKVKQDFSSNVKIDFSNCPDLAQTVFVVCTALKIKLEAKGLESLRIKETDRIEALKQELAKFGGKVTEKKQTWFLEFDESVEIKKPVFINTYEDHRMAMAFAPLASYFDLIIENPSVVNKSYPSFWEDWEKVGFELVVS